MHAGQTFPRWLSLCAAALALLQLGGMLHLAAAPHAVCWEHGVVVELDAPQDAGEVPAAREGLARGALPLVWSNQHPHCPALWIHRQARVDTPGTLPLLGCTHAVPALTIPDQVPSPPGWALRHAPKQSPPV